MRSVEQTTPAALVLMLLGLVSCSNLEPVTPQQPITDPAQMYMTLAIDRPAVNLSMTAPYNALQLTASPQNGAGELMVGLPAPTFRSSDSTAVKVTPDGMLTALKVATGVKVTAELVAPGNVRHVDTATVNVKDLPSPPELASLSIDPVPPDSVQLPINGQTTNFITSFFWFSVAGFSAQINLGPRLRALDVMDNPVAGLVTEYTSLDPTIAKVDRWTGAMSPLRPGSVRMVARTAAYGITKADTAVFTVTLPSFQDVNIQALPGAASIFGPVVTIRPYGFVTWFNKVGRSVEVVFDDPTHVAQPPDTLCALAIARSSNAEACGTGNFSIQPPADPNNVNSLPTTARVRQFPVPGVYSYHDTQTGAEGQIIVTNDVGP